MKLRFLPGLVPVLIFSVTCAMATESDTRNVSDDAKPVSEPAVLKVSYMTLRNLSGERIPAEMYGDERDQLRAGECVFSKRSLDFLEPLTNNGLIYIPESKTSLENVEVVDIDEFWKGFAARAKGAKPILYLHGYNTGFEKACEQAALFQENLGLQDRLILFSWPSDGALLNYPRDEADLFWSVAPLEATLEQMVKQFGEGGFDVIAHSLGARGLFLALVQLAHDQHRQLPLLNQLIFTAPDIDAGIFQQYLADILPLARNITLYVSDNDRPLALSREVHGYARLGETGPHLNKLDGIEIIDISEVGVQSFSGHLYHLYHGRIIEDLNLLLNQGDHAAQRELNAMGNNRWRLKKE